MEKGWVKIFTSNDLHKAAIIQALLDEHRVKCVTVNKMDSSYLSFGEIEIYVKQEDVINALYLINNK